MSIDSGIELRKTPDKGDGVFATRSFKVGETVVVGVFDEVLSGNNAHASQISKDEFVLLTGLACKVNHSCDPNCGIRVNEARGHNYVAMRDIAIGDEITFDYAMQNYDVEYAPEVCMCGSRECRGQITGWKDLPEERRKQYEGFVASYLLELDSELVCVG